MKKKILHIQVLPKLSGVQRISLEIFKGLSESDYDKWVIFSDSLDVGDKEDCKSAFEKVGVRVLFSKNLQRKIGFHDIFATIEIYKLCRKEKFDIVHTHSTKPGVIGRIAATLARVPFVIHTVHGLAFYQFIKFPRWQFYWFCEMLASLFCDKIILVNQYYGKYFKWFKKKTLTIYNGIDFSQFSYRLEKQKRCDDQIKILFVGRLDIQKDPMTLLHAAKKVSESVPNISFTLVGDGEKYIECHEYIKSNGLENNIYLEGWQTNVEKYYTSHDIFCLSSIYEAFGLIFLEAGFHYLPTVATDVEGIPEVVINNQTGYLVPPQDATLLAKKLLLLINDPELRYQMGSQAYKWVTENFTAEKMLEGYKRLYDSQMK